MKFPEIGEGLAGKHTLNMCQIYANNYRQHYTDWTRNPWTECQDLMVRDFGVPFPSVTEAIQRNPQAMLDFFRWNIRLIPDGIQVLLFGATAGRGQPDYVGVTTGSRFALVCSVGLITIVLAGLFLLWRERNYWWKVWLKTRIWGWLALTCVLPSMVLVMIMPRPRPSYLFNLGLFIMALTGMCSFVILHRWTVAKRLVTLMPIIMCLLIVVVPSYYPQLLSSQSDLVNRPILTEYRRLQPYLEQISQPEQKLLGHTAYFLGTVVMRDPAKAVDVFDFVQSEATDLSFAEWIDSQGITVIYLDELVLDYSQVQEFIQELDLTEWQLLHEVNTANESWMLLQRSGENQTLQPLLESVSRQ